MDVGVAIAIITSGGAFATAATGTIVAGVRGSKVDRHSLAVQERALALQELEASLKHRAEDMNLAIERQKATDERVDEFVDQLATAEKEKQVLRGRVAALEREVNQLERHKETLRKNVATLDREVHQLERDKEDLQRNVQTLTERLRTLESGPSHG